VKVVFDGVQVLFVNTEKTMSYQTSKLSSVF